MKKDLEEIFKEVIKPDEFKDSKLDEIFKFDTIFIPSIDFEDQFEKTALELRSRFSV